MGKMSIGIDFGIGIDKNSWYRPGIVSKPQKLVSPIPIDKKKCHHIKAFIIRATE